MGKQITKNMFGWIFITVLLMMSTLNGAFPYHETYEVLESKDRFSNIILSTNKNLYQHHVEPTLAIDDNFIHVGFKNAETHDGPGLAVSYTFSTDGEIWTSPYNMEQFWKQSGQSDPWMIVFENILYYVYLEYTLTGNTQMTLARTSDQGSNWEFTIASYGSGFADKETFTIDENGYIYLAYDDQLDATHTEVKLSRSFDGGNSFIENVTMSDSLSAAYVGPYIVSAGFGVLYNAIGYLDDAPGSSDILFDKSTNFGETWGLDTDLNPSYNASYFAQGISGSPAEVTLPALSIDDNGRIYVVWEDVSTDISTKNWDVYMRYSDDTGDSWSDRIRINENVEGNSWMPDLDIDSSGNVHVIYYDNNTGFSNLMYRVFYPSNNSLSVEYKISTEGTSSEFTRLGDYITVRVDNDDNIHMVWTDGRNDVLDIYYATNKPDASTVLSSGNSVQSSSSSAVSSSSSKSSDSTLSVKFALLGLILIPILKKKVELRKTV